MGEKDPPPGNVDESRIFSFENAERSVLELVANTPEEYFGLTMVFFIDSSGTAHLCSGTFREFCLNARCTGKYRSLAPLEVAVATSERADM